MLTPGAAAPDISGANINPKAPDITGSLSALSGKVVVAIFFAWWCPHCGNELGFLQNLWKKYQEQEVGFIAVHTETDDAHARQYGYANARSAAIAKLTALGIQFPAVQDDTANALFSHYDGPGYGFPQLYILDKDHIIHSVVDGEEPESATDNRILDAHSSRDPVDIAIVMDVSDSMNSPASAGVSKLAVMKQAA
jgi:thiol-disulfide isomerase/thioredoxin